MIRKIMIITHDTIVCQKNLKAHYLDYYMTWFWDIDGYTI